MSRRTHHGRRVTAEITIDAPADEVWRAWADPERIAQWFVDRAEGTARPGEVMTWIFDAFQFRLPVPILEAEPGKRFVTGAEIGADVGGRSLTLPALPGDRPSDAAPAQPALLEVDLETQGGSTRLRLVNSGFSEDPAHDDEVEGVRSGWANALANLKYWLERHRDGRRQSRLWWRPTAASWEVLASLYAGAPGLSRWLDDVRAPDRLTVGERIAARIGGRPLSGAVLSHTGREALLEWSEVGGTLALKAFLMGSQRVVGLDLSVWRGDIEAVAPAVEQAMDRLAGI